MPVIPDIGDVFSGCEILARCGNGAYGITFLARNPLNSKVIIKIVGSFNSKDRELAGLRNYMLVAGKHPNLLQIYHIGEHDDGFYYTMEAADNIACGDEYVPATLGNLFQIKKSFTPAEAVNIIRELAEGLQVMHRAGLIHRDIKPDNIIFVNGKPKLSDPGLVIALGEEASFAGTPGFIPPELLEAGGVIDQGADVYALGKVFYCLATGQSPKHYPQLPIDMPAEVCRQLYPAMVKMCNRKADKRCKTVQELLDCLPEELKDPNWFERLYDDFRSWKQLNDAKYKLVKYTFAALFAGVLLCIGGALWYRFELCRRQTEIMRSLKEFKQINCDRKDVLLLQFKAYLPHKLKEYTQLQNSLKNAERSRVYQTINAAQKKLEAFLSAAARELIPQLPEKTVDVAAGSAALGRMYGFLSAPLAEYLTEKERKDLKSDLEKYKRKLYSGRSTLRCGDDLESAQYYYMPLKFVPPGATILPHSSKLHKIPYHFWIGKNEVIGEDFVRRMKISPQLAPDVTRPLERIVWNDILNYCMLVTLSLKNQAMLPENYIVRPLNEAEWQYAADNGWLGKDTVPLNERANIAGNSQNRTWAPQRMKPDKLGIYDIYGNVAEIVDHSEPPQMQQSAVVRGGSFLSRKDVEKYRVEYLKYQNIPYDIGFRLAVAPGDMSYFEKKFFLGGPVQCTLRGKVYELIGANIGSFNWHRADDLCRLLGGRLAEIEDLTHLQQLRKAMPLTGRWETFLGGTCVNGQWLWQHSRRKIDFGKWRNIKRRDDEKHLTLLKDRWDRAKHRRSAILLCEWDEKSFPQRNKHLAAGKKLPFEKCRFDYRGRRYVLFALSVHWLTAKRICELLGGSLATPDDADRRKHIIKQLAPYSKHRIFFGGYSRFGKWYWLNGKPAEVPEDERISRSIPTVNQNYTALHNNKIFNSQSGCMFLCEWRINSASSH